MDTRPRTPTSIRVPIAWKFLAVLALVIPSLLAVYAHGVSVLGTIAGLGLLAGVGATLLLIRSVVVRTKEYSRSQRGSLRANSTRGLGRAERRAHGSGLGPQRDGGAG